MGPACDPPTTPFFLELNSVLGGYYNKTVLWIDAVIVLQVDSPSSRVSQPSETEACLSFLIEYRHVLHGQVLAIETEHKADHWVH